MIVTKRPTQKMQVLDLLKQRGATGITALDTFELIKTMRLAAYIGFLREDGYTITSTTITVPSGKHVAKYVLVKGPQVQRDRLFDDYPNGQGN